ncbi:hypothetical protein ACRALDRAFT_209370 [Sodiomyces alcalophilus JCM 7366]|uniref:uncharacterized protein n=1 Tax=Sodiomyces alcalophilus JCM 7366 TaxID=591952 RepID=UPI0039B4B9E8
MLSHVLPSRFLPSMIEDICTYKFRYILDNPPPTIIRVGRLKSIEICCATIVRRVKLHRFTTTQTACLHLPH